MPCVKCGSCCRHIRLPLSGFVDADTFTWLSYHNIAIIDDKGKHTLLIPLRCNHLGVDNQCLIYDTRPKACRVFEAGGEACKLSRELEGKPC